MSHSSQTPQICQSTKVRIYPFGEKMDVGVTSSGVMVICLWFCFSLKFVLFDCKNKMYLVFKNKQFVAFNMLISIITIALKETILIDLAGNICFISPLVGASKHDVVHLREQIQKIKSTLSSDEELILDKGYQGIEEDFESNIVHVKHKKPKGKILCEEKNWRINTWKKSEEKSNWRLEIQKIVLQFWEQNSEWSRNILVSWLLSCLQLANSSKNSSTQVTLSKLLRQKEYRSFLRNRDKIKNEKRYFSKNLSLLFLLFSLIHVIYIIQ